MPTYSYACPACGHRFDIYQAFTDDALTQCPQCGAESLRKVFSSVGVVFKGSGFYRNDSRGKQGTSEPASSSSGSKESSGSSSSSSSSDSSGSTSSSSSSSGSSGGSGSSSGSSSSSGSTSSSSSPSRSNASS